MLIQINENYRVTSDARQFILQKRAGVDKKTGEDNWSSVSFHPDPQSLVSTMIWRDFRGGGSETLTQALKRVETLSQELKTAFRPLLDIKLIK